METKAYFTSTSLSINVDKNELELINENFEDVTNDNEKMTFKKYFFKLHSKALSVVKPSLSRKEDTDKILRLESELDKINENYQGLLSDLELKDENLFKRDAEIEALNNKISLLSDKGPEKVLNDEIIGLKEEIRVLSDKQPEKVLKNEIATLKDEIRVLSGKEPVKVIEKVNVEIPVRLSENQTLVNLSPVEADIMNLVVKNETVRTKRTITPEILFKDIFNRYILNGACDFFPIPSKQALREIADKHNITPKD